LDNTSEIRRDPSEQTFVDFAELLAALGDIVPAEGLVNPEGVLSARDFYDWFVQDGQTVLSREHVAFPEPKRLREIARFIELAATAGESAGIQ